jgi:uncharacterized membrane protein
MGARPGLHQPCPDLAPRDRGALVAALRETSVLFAAAIAVIVLKEPLQRPRIIAAVMIVAGLVLIRLQ